MARARAPIVGPFHDAHFNGFGYHARRYVFLGDAKAVAERAVGQAAVIVHVAEHGMLVAAAHALLPGELAKGLAPENDHLSAVVVGAKIRRRQVRLLDYVDHLIDSATSFFAYADPAHERGKCFVARAGGKSINRLVSK